MLFDPIPLSDTLIILLLGTIVGLSAYWLERTAMFGKMQKLVARKSLHVIGVGACTIAAALIQNHLFLILLVAIAELFLFYLVQFRNFFTQDGKKSWGIVYFPLIYMVLLFLFPHNRFLVVAPMGLLALADAAATLFGEYFAKSFFNLTGDRKSVVGSSSFILVSFLWFVLLGFFGYGQGQNWPQYLVTAFCISILTAGTEALGSKGRDNLWVPAAAAFLLWATFKTSNPADPYLLGIALVLVVPCALLAYNFKLLSNSGAVAAALMGITIFIYGDFSLLPILTFFITGALMGKIPGKPVSDEKAGLPRDSVQVFANGGVALLLSYINCIWPSNQNYILYLVACAAACADTFGSEIGTRFGKYTIDIIRIRRVNAGVSGGISIIGFLATFAGAALIALFAWNKEMFVYITLLGVCGSVIDSLLGAVLQAKYLNQAGEWTDIPGKNKISGFTFINNDAVNFISILSTVLIAFFIL